MSAVEPARVHDPFCCKIGIHETQFLNDSDIVAVKIAEDRRKVALPHLGQETLQSSVRRQKEVDMGIEEDRGFISNVGSRTDAIRVPMHPRRKNLHLLWNGGADDGRETSSKVGESLICLQGGKVMKEIQSLIAQSA